MLVLEGLGDDGLNCECWQNFSSHGASYFTSVSVNCKCVSVCVLHYLMEFLKWSSAGFFTVQLLSSHRSASIGSSVKRSDGFVAAYCKTTQNKERRTCNHVRFCCLKLTSKLSFPFQNANQSE